MKSTTLFIFCVVFIPLTFSQGVTFNVGYVSDLHAGTNWYNERGARFGIGVDGIQLDDTPLSLSVRYNGMITGAKRNVRLEGIQFEMPDTSLNGTGFARAEFRKTALSMDNDLGYSTSDAAVFVPYISLGPRFEIYSSKVHYELYEFDTCLCNNTTEKPLTNTISLGFNSGLGFKLRFGPGFAIDFRATYYGGWSLLNKNNVLLPVASSFNIDDYGEPGFSSSGNRYNDGFLFTVNIILPIPSLDGFNNYSNDYSYDDNYEEDHYQDNNSNEGNSSSECEGGELTPISRRPPPN